MPFYQQTSMYHWLLRKYMYAKYKPTPVDAQDLEVYREIEEKGFILIPDFMSVERANQLCVKVEEAYRRVKETKHGDYFAHKRGHERIGNIDAHVPETKTDFYENEMIWRLARAYVSKDVLAYRREADFKYERGANYQANIAHFDDWRHRFKAFLFLNDVSEENSPMIFYRYSHLHKGWRKPHERVFTTQGKEGRYGHFFPQEMDRLCAQEGLEPVVLTVKAGTLFLGDFRGIHQGTVLRSGKRVLLNCTFGL